MIALRVLSRLDEVLGWTWDWKLELGAAQSALVTIIGATLSFVVFTFSSLLVAIQVASAQLTPRIIATALLRDNAVWLIGEKGPGPDISKGGRPHYWIEGVFVQTHLNVLSMALGRGSGPSGGG